MGIIARISEEHCSERGLEAVQRLKRHPKDESVSALVGISRGNSYFTQNNVGLVTEAALEDFASVGYMLPDKPSVFTLEALGSEHKKAETKSRLDFNRYSSMIRSELQRLLYDESGAKVLRWDTVEGNSEYGLCAVALQRLFDSNTQFRTDIETETERMLVGNLGGDTWKSLGKAENDKRVATGVQFLLMELSCIASSANLLDSELSVYIYHRPMEVMRKLLDGEYEGFESPNAGYLVYEPFAGK